MNCILFHQLAPHSEVEDGLTQVLDLVGAGGESGECVEGEAGVGAEGFRVGVRRGQAGEAGRGQPVACRLAGRAGRLQLVAERHQLIDLRHNAMLFGERWQGKL